MHNTGKVTCSLQHMSPGQAVWKLRPAAGPCCGSGGMTGEDAGCRVLLHSAGIRNAQGARLYGLLLAGRSVRLQRGPGNLCHRAATCSRHDADITRQLKAMLAHAADMMLMVTQLRTTAALQAVWLGYHVNAQHACQLG